jgi:hypothetical protein
MLSAAARAAHGVLFFRLVRGPKNRKVSSENARQTETKNYGNNLLDTVGGSR